MVREVNLLMVLAGMLAGALLLSRFMAVFTLRSFRCGERRPRAWAPAICWCRASP